MCRITYMVLHKLEEQLAAAAVAAELVQAAFLLLISKHVL